MTIASKPSGMSFIIALIMLSITTWSCGCDEGISHSLLVKTTSNELLILCNNGMMIQPGMPNATLMAPNFDIEAVNRENLFGYRPSILIQAADAYKYNSES